MRYPVSCECDGKTRKGIYWVSGRILTIATGLGGKSRQIGKLDSEDLARRLLAELVSTGKA